MPVIAQMFSPGQAVLHLAGIVKWLNAYSLPLDNNCSSTSSPVDYTMPTISCPGMSGNFGMPCFSQSPSMRCRLDLHTPQVFILTRRSFLPSVGIETSFNFNGLLSIGAVLFSSIAFNVVNRCFDRYFNVKLWVVVDILYQHSLTGEVQE